MRRKLPGSLALLVQLAWAAVASAQVSPARAEHAVAVADLIGRSPKEVRARLFDGANGWPLQPAFQIASDNDRVSFIAVADLMLDAESARREAAVRTHAGGVPWAPYTSCQIQLVSLTGAAAPGALALLMFRNDRLETAFGPEPETQEQPGSSDGKAPEAFIQPPHDSIFLAQRGYLPLNDGLGFLERWRRNPLAPADQLAVACTTPAPPAVSKPAPPAPTTNPRYQANPVTGAIDSALDNLIFRPFAAVVFLPYTLTQPLKNEERETTRHDGHALLDSIHVGTRLGKGVEDFVATHHGVRMYRSGTVDYVVLSVDLGGPFSGNVTTFNDSALVGVRGDRIAWISPPSKFGPRAELLCLDENGVPGSTRPGCSVMGYFSP